MKIYKEYEYVLSVEEVQKIIFDHLVRAGLMVPVGPDSMNVSWNAPGEVFVKFTTRNEA